MRIAESKNLRYTKFPYNHFEPTARVESDHCILESFHNHDDRLELNFQNRTIAFIEARNPEGGKEIDRIKEKLPKFIGKSYKEILNFNFKGC